jgi:hypothetical protein
VSGEPARTRLIPMSPQVGQVLLACSFLLAFGVAQ